MRLIANGRTRAQTRNNAPRKFPPPFAGVALRADEDATPVAICTVTLPEEFAVTASLAGLNVQDELDGSELHAKLKVPLDPLIGARAITKLAVCPLAIVWLDWPCEETEKSNPMPESATCAFAGSAGLEIVRFPVCWPALDGANLICAVQLAPIGMEAPHVVDAI